ncbi:MAG: hypothetical protein FJX65_11095 [Alphaproteobacteria bacterium]|nr:hypothetical protein [Alphaproteobacteria bacterium]
MQHRSYRYKINYVGPKGERGRERCVVTVHGDGDRTIRALCEMDDSQVLRDVTYTVDRHWRPRDAFVRLSVADRFMGSSWFRFDGNRAECEAFTAAEGRLSQRLVLERAPASFVTHPVACDVWHFAGIDRTLGDQIQESLSASCSPLPNGASGPMLGISRHRFRYRGRQRTRSPAGTFDTEHAEFVGRDGVVRLKAWCTIHDRILVRMEFEPLQSVYELVELEGSAG